MEAKEKITEFKEKAFDALESWMEGRIDDFASNNPKMKIASIYMKRGARNYLARERGKIGQAIDNASLFLCDENGNIDSDLLFDDLITMFKEMDETEFGKGFIRGTIGKGVIRFELPDNPVMNLLFGDTGAIKITEDDFLELKELLS